MYQIWYECSCGRKWENKKCDIISTVVVNNYISPICICSDGEVRLKIIDTKELRIKKFKRIIELQK